MKTEEKQRVVLSENGELAERLRKAAQEKQIHLQALQDTFSMMFPEKYPLDFILDTAKDSKESVETLIRMMVYEQNEPLKKMGIPKNKAIDLVALPEGYDEFMEAVGDYHTFLAKVSNKFTSDTPLDFYTVEDNEVKLTDAFSTHVESKTVNYATDEEAAVLEDLEKVHKHLLALQKKYPHLRLVAAYDAHKHSNPVFYTGSGSGKLFLNEQAVRYHG